MLIDGPREWAEAAIPSGSKLDLLTHAYNASLGIVALAKGASIVLTRFHPSDASATTATDEVMEMALDELVLHPQDPPKASKADLFRYVSWSRASLQSHYVAIATIDRVEVWSIDEDLPVASSSRLMMKAVMVGSHTMARIRGICWHPIKDILLVYTDVDLTLLEVANDGHLHAHPVSINQDDKDKQQTIRSKTKQCVWSPCGLTLARASDRNVQFLSWVTVHSLTSSPSVALYRVTSSSSSSTLLGTTEAKIGSITALTMLSASLCAIVTDVPLVMEDVKTSMKQPSLAACLGTTTPVTASVFAVAPPPPPPSLSSNIIDLTSLRITATSTSSLLKILDQPTIQVQETEPPNLPQKRPSHLTLVGRSTSTREWQQQSQIPIPQLTIPDVLGVEGMRLVVGSTISSHLVALHLETHRSTGWSASVSGELDLPDGHVCRGLRLAKTSPFAQVASTEKAKQRTFFHVASGPQRIQLSKFKLPHRRQQHQPLVKEDDGFSATVSSFSAQAAAVPVDGSPLLLAVLARMDAMQTLMVARFDQLEQKLSSICDRLDQLEVAGGQEVGRQTL